MSVLQLKETISFEHKGINIYIHLDYERGLASFVEKDGRNKQWLFAERTRDYLGGWYRILEAMQEATKYADTRLKEQAEARANIKEKEMFNMMVALSEAIEDSESA